MKLRSIFCCSARFGNSNLRPERIRSPIKNVFVPRSLWSYVTTSSTSDPPPPHWHRSCLDEWPHLTNETWLCPKELAVRRWTINDPWPTVLAIDDFYSATADKGERHWWGGLVGEVKDYFWIQRRQLGAAWEGKGGQLSQCWRRERSNAKMMCGVSSIVLCSAKLSKSKLCTPATKLPPSPLSTLHDKFDSEKELCYMTDIDFVQLSHLFQLGIEFLHRGMLPIFDALVYLSCHHQYL
jgi:hypothetical protein